MTDNDPFWDWPEDDGRAAGDGRRRRDFDPLFSTWDEAVDEGQPVYDSSDTLSAFAWVDPRGAPAWEASPPGEGAWSAPGPGRPTSWYANRWGEAQTGAMTAAQASLRASVVTLPRAERNRAAAALFAFWGILLLSAGVLASALSYSAADAGGIYIVWIGAIGVGILWTLYGLAGILSPDTVRLPYPQIRIQRELAETGLLALLIFLSVRASFQNFRVEGASMYPSLENGEYLIVNKLSYAKLDTSVFNFLPFFDAGDTPLKHLWGEPHRGDVIVFRAPTSPNRDFIKRIIGLPGDTIEIGQDGKVVLNGKTMDEPYITGVTNCNSTCEPLTLPASGSAEARAKCGSDACYFVMGDNRQNSSDSRQGWLVPEENIIGKAVITYWHEGGPEFDAAPNHSVSANESGQ